MTRKNSCNASQSTSSSVSDFPYPLLTRIADGSNGPEVFSLRIARCAIERILEKAIRSRQAVRRQIFDELQVDSCREDPPPWVGGVPRDAAPKHGSHMPLILINILLETTPQHAHVARLSGSAADGS
jgi:hypothetical protein